MENDSLNDKELLEKSCGVALLALLRGLKIFAGRAGNMSDFSRFEDFFPKTEISLLHEENNQYGEFYIPTWMSGNDFETSLQLLLNRASGLALGLDGLESGHNNSQLNCEKIRLSSLFEAIEPTSKNKRSPQHIYRLEPLSPNSIFTVKTDSYHVDTDEGRGDYQKLWRGFMQALEWTPTIHREEWTLWLDNFDTLWGVYSQLMPLGASNKDISLYDHSKTTAALSVALWRFHQNLNEEPGELTDDRQENKFLFVQGNLFGVNEILWAQAEASDDYAEKLLRGRSFHISLLSQCAALKVLDELALPCTSQLIDAAGKFLIVAPNSPCVIEALQQIQQELDVWFLEHYYGQAGVSITWTEACANDFYYQSSHSSEETPYQQFYRRLSEQLEDSDFRHFNLCEKNASSIVFDRFLDDFDCDKGICMLDGRSPASECLDQGAYVSKLALDQLNTGDWATRCNHLFVTRNRINANKALNTPLFGYHIAFVEPENISEGHEQFNNAGLQRIWEFSLPNSEEQALWHGYARRSLNAYVPVVETDDLAAFDQEKYYCINKPLKLGEAKSFTYLACCDRVRNDSGSWQGVSALTAVKGDIDNAGRFIEKGLGSGVNFTKTIALSRQINTFFYVYLPWLCRSQYADCHTVFAGGDDFILVGPWFSQIRLVGEIYRAFQRYVAGNPELHFSAGVSTAHRSQSVVRLCALADRALKQAKRYRLDDEQVANKNAVSCFNQIMNWDHYFELTGERYRRFEALSVENNMNNRYIYGLIELVDMAETVNEIPENAIWHSYFSYRTSKLIDCLRLDKTLRSNRQAEIVDEIVNRGIKVFGAHYKVTLLCQLNRQRN